MLLSLHYNYYVSEVHFDLMCDFICSDIMAKRDRVKLRFSTNRLKDLCDKLSEDQKRFVRDHGFGYFLNLSVFTINIPLLDFIMRNFQLGVNEFQFGNKSIRYTKSMVKQNLGFLCGDTPVNINNVPDHLIEEARPFMDDYYEAVGSKPSIRKAITLCLAEHNEEAFIRSFMLVALSTMIAPNSQNSLELHLLNYLMRPADILNYDWAAYAFEYIREEVQRFQGYVSSNDPAIQNKSHIYGSCLPLLVVSILITFSNYSKCSVSAGFMLCVS